MVPYTATRYINGDDCVFYIISKLRKEMTQWANKYWLVYQRALQCLHHTCILVQSAGTRTPISFRSHMYWAYILLQDVSKRLLMKKKLFATT